MLEYIVTSVLRAVVHISALEMVLEPKNNTRYMHHSLCNIAAGNCASTFILDIQRTCARPWLK